MLLISSSPSSKFSGMIFCSHRLSKMHSVSLIPKVVEAIFPSMAIPWRSHLIVLCTLDTCHTWCDDFPQSMDHASDNQDYNWLHVEAVTTIFVSFLFEPMEKYKFDYIQKIVMWRNWPFVYCRLCCCDHLFVHNCDAWNVSSTKMDLCTFYRIPDFGKHMVWNQCVSFDAWLDHLNCWMLSHNQ